jgi:hypothetical protein
LRRRDFIILLSGATVAWPLAAVAEQAIRMHRIGILICAVSGMAAFLALSADGASPTPTSPTFRSDGPNATAYGAVVGYPLGLEPHLHFMVGSFTHVDQLFRIPVSELRRAENIYRPGCGSRSERRRTRTGCSTPPGTRPPGAAFRQYCATTLGSV